MRVSDTVSEERVLEQTPVVTMKCAEIRESREGEDDKYALK